MEDLSGEARPREVRVREARVRRVAVRRRTDCKFWCVLEGGGGWLGVGVFSAGLDVFVSLTLSPSTCLFCL